MAVNNKFMPQNGLFNNISVGDVQRSMNAEEAARINNAGRGAPNYYAQLISRAGQQQAETVRKLAQTVGGMLPGPDASAGFANLTDFLPGLKQDSRLNKAVKRDSDKQEIMKVLGEYQSNDGVITKDELKKGFGLLMSKGYPNEAQKWLAMSQSMGQFGIKERETKVKEDLLKVKQDSLPIEAQKAAAKVLQAQKVDKRYIFDTPTYYEKGGKFFQRSVRRDKSGGPSKVVTTELEGQPVGKRFMTPKQIVELESGTSKAQAQGKQDVEKEGNWIDKRQLLIEQGSYARDDLSNLANTIELADKVDTGGYNKMIIAVQDFLGTTTADVGELVHDLGSSVISRLKEMGAKPTDRDLAYLERVMAGVGKSKASNLVILKKMAVRMNKIASTGAYLENHKGITQDTFNKDRYKAQTFDWKSTVTPKVSKPVTKAWGS
tara:strand:+ start:79 stop:1380 length:1302 start_codon:yes stop_codon:yes gene_type:complete